MAGSFRGCLGDGQRPGIHLRRGMLLARPRGLHMEPLVFSSCFWCLKNTCFLFLVVGH